MMRAGIRGVLRRFARGGDTKAMARARTGALPDMNRGLRP